MTAALKTPSNIIAASRDLVQRHEGRRQFPYYDTRGKLTIAVGRNLTDRGLADDEIDYLFANDLIIALQICQDLYPCFASFTPARQAALISMAFNLGKPRLARFRRMRAAINRGNWQGAPKAHGTSRARSSTTCPKTSANPSRPLCWTTLMWSMLPGRSFTG